MDTGGDDDEENTDEGSIGSTDTDADTGTDDGGNNMASAARSKRKIKKLPPLGPGIAVGPSTDGTATHRGKPGLLNQQQVGSAGGSGAAKSRPRGPRSGNKRLRLVRLSWSQDEQDACCGFEADQADDESVASLAHCVAADGQLHSIELPAIEGHPAAGSILCTNRQQDEAKFLGVVEAAYALDALAVTLSGRGLHAAACLLQLLLERTADGSATAIQSGGLVSWDRLASWLAGGVRQPLGEIHEGCKT